MAMMHYQTPINIITGPSIRMLSHLSLKMTNYADGLFYSEGYGAVFGLYKSPMISASTHNLNLACFHWIKISLIEKL